MGGVPDANFSPEMSGYSGQGQFRFWCQKVLPLVYDDSLSYYELLSKIIYYLNTLNTNVENLYNAYVQLQEYVNENLPVTEGGEASER